MIRSILFEFVSSSGRAGSYIAILLYIIISIFAAYLGARVGARTHFLPLAPSMLGATGVTPKIIDTSVIVDGRIVEIFESGFLEGPFILPRFILLELQAVADSTDGMKRARGRRGLEVLDRLRELGMLEVSERDYPDVRGADAKLVRMGQDLGGKLLTNDYNLNRVAHLEGVAVLNINELANAVKPVVLPGEEMRVQVVREGKEPHQGVAYLDDGTMIVIEQGRRLLGETTDVVVTSVLQTAAGLPYSRDRKLLPMKWAAVVVAAGRGTRFGAPKQLIDAAGAPLLSWSLRTFAAMPEVAEIVVVTEREWIDQVASVAREAAGGKCTAVVAGGATRRA